MTLVLDDRYAVEQPASAELPEVPALDLRTNRTVLLRPAAAESTWPAHPTLVRRLGHARLDGVLFAVEEPSVSLDRAGGSFALGDVARLFDGLAWLQSRGRGLAGMSAADLRVDATGRMKLRPPPADDGGATDVSVLLALLEGADATRALIEAGEAPAGAGALAIAGWLRQGGTASVASSRSSGTDPSSSLGAAGPEAAEAKRFADPSAVAEPERSAGPEGSAQSGRPGGTTASAEPNAVVPDLTAPHASPRSPPGRPASGPLGEAPLARPRLPGSSVGPGLSPKRSRPRAGAWLVLATLSGAALAVALASTGDADEYRSPPLERGPAPRRAETAPPPIEVGALPAARAPASPQYWVQVLATSSPDNGRAQQTRQIARHPAALRGLSSRLETIVDAGGRTLYRVQFGPLATSEDARAVCERIRQRGDPCMVRAVPVDR